MCGGGIIGGHVVLLLTPVDVCRPGYDWGAALNRGMRKLLGRGRDSARALMRFDSHADALEVRLVARTSPNVHSTANSARK